MLIQFLYNQSDLPSNTFNHFYYNITVARVLVWETAAPPNFICMCMCVSYYSLPSYHHITLVVSPCQILRIELTLALLPLFKVRKPVVLVARLSFATEFFPFAKRQNKSGVKLL